MLQVLVISKNVCIRDLFDFEMDEHCSSFQTRAMISLLGEKHEIECLAMSEIT